MKRLVLLSVLCLSFFLLSAQVFTSVSGKVVEAITGECLVGVSVYSKSSLRYGTTTDTHGLFSLKAPIGDTICVHFIGYEEQTFVMVKQIQPLNITLKKSDIHLSTIEVVAPRVQLRSSQMIELNARTIEQIPSFLARADVVRAAQNMPGIESGKEGYSSMLVRGGGPGENQFLLDGVPLLYVSHFGGLMSVFNPDMINSMHIYKGGFPANYGGKLSSIVDLTQKKGNNTKRKASYSVGITDISFSVEGPGLHDNSSFIVTGRKTLIDFLIFSAAKISQASGGQDYNITYGFADINAKYTWNYNSNNTFAFNAYCGEDYVLLWKSIYAHQLRQQSLFADNWGNILLSGEWNHTFGPRLFVNNTLYSTRYHLTNISRFSEINEAVADTTIYQSKGLSAVNDVSLKSDWKYCINEWWNLNFGVHLSIQNYQPNNFTSTANNLSAERIPCSNDALYVSNALRYGRLGVNLGMRLSAFFGGGLHSAIPEPRLSVNYLLGKTHFEASYMHVSQNTHLLASQTSMFANEIWIPSDITTGISTSHQASFGLSRTLSNGTYAFQASAYYKTLHNLVSYRDGYLSLLGDNDWHSKIEIGGEGKSMGAEFMLQKTQGKITGSVAYTYSHTTRRFDGVNFGQTYIYEFDRPHSINLTFNYVPSRLWRFGAAWTYQSGLPFTPIVGRVLVPRTDNAGNIIMDEILCYGERNSERMRAYHRLDISAIRTGINEKGRKIEWTFAVFNVYNRKNPSCYYYGDINGDPLQYSNNTENIYLWQRSFMPIIPSVSYKVYLK